MCDMYSHKNTHVTGINEMPGYGYDVLNIDKTCSSYSNTDKTCSSYSNTAGLHDSDKIKKVLSHFSGKILTLIKKQIS